MKGIRPLLALVALLGIAPSHAQTDFTWTGTGSNSFWSMPENWTGTTVPVSAATTSLIFTGSTTTNSTNNIGNPFTLNAMRFSDLTGNFVVASSFPFEFVQNGATLPVLEQNGNFTATINGKINASPSLTIGGTGSGDLRLLTFYETSVGETLTINRNAASLTVLNGGLVNSGTTIVQSGTTRMRGLQNSGVVSLGNGGSLVFSDTDVSNYVLSAGSALLGTVGSSITVQDITLFVGSPSVNFSTSGNLNFLGGTITGTSNFNISVGSTFRWTAGDIEGNAGNATTIFLGNGIIEGTGAKNIGRSLTFNQGQLAWNEGNLNLTTDGTLTIAGTIVTASGSAGNITTSGPSFGRGLAVCEFAQRPATVS